MNDYVIAEDVAIEEVKAFIQYHTDKPTTSEKVEEKYASLLSSFMRGLLDFSKPDAPVFKLREPIKSESGEIAVESITFKTRMLSSDYQNLSRGINLEKDQFKLGNVITAHLAQLGTTAMLDKFPNKHDFKTVQEITALFT